MSRFFGNFYRKFFLGKRRDFFLKFCRKFYSANVEIFFAKRELKEDYNMVKFSDATLEWYEQAANFVQYAVGKTAEELSGAELQLNEEGHLVFVDETLRASVSISVDGMTDVLVKAMSYAR